MSKTALASVKGEKVTLKPKSRSCDNFDQLEEIARAALKQKKPLAIDLFCGAGGLSLGLHEAGFNVILGVDKYQPSVETHRAQFGGASVHADLSDPEVIQKIGEALKNIDIDLVAGGPPCQPFSQAGKSKIRHLVKEGTREENDQRRELWQSFVAVVEALKPRAVLVENVPEMALGDDAIVLRQLVSELEKLGYVVHTRILAAWQYEVPQFRQRLFLVGVEAGVKFSFPDPVSEIKPKLRDAISDLPSVEAGARDLVLPYTKPRKLSPFQQWYRKGVSTRDKDKIYDHIVRDVREDDLEAFRLMDHRTRYSDLPEELKRYRDDIFDDKYKRLSWEEPSRSITAHLAKDGYWYIHPEQHRCLSVREAARVQSFPDWFRFSGYPSNAYRQIGEAVPPLLGKHLGKAIFDALYNSSQSSNGHVPSSSNGHVSTNKVSEALRRWIKNESPESMVAPWRKTQNLWSVLLGMTLFEKFSEQQVHLLWPTFQKRWNSPEAFLADSLKEAAVRATGCGQVYSKLVSIAENLVESRDDDNLEIPDITESQLNFAIALANLSNQRPPSVPIARVAERVLGNGHEKSSIGHEQLMLARLIGVDEDSLAYAGVLEIADRYCRPSQPVCRQCPVRELCTTARKADG
jgi:DNA (cytosine-5)-methyltransferase 1